MMIYTVRYESDTSDMSSQTSDMSSDHSDTDVEVYETSEYELLEGKVLCAERVTQMTRAYNDIEAVTLLLEEKERDLELAARIGQSLLEKNKVLEKKNTEQEEELKDARDKLRQLRCDLARKEALLQMYLEEESSPETPETERLQQSLGLANMGGLQKRVKSLEEENLSLLSQSASLQTETVLAEEKETALVADIIGQLDEYKSQVFYLQDEVVSKTDVNVRLQDDVTTLTARGLEKDAQIKKITEENTGLTTRLQAAQEVQRDLAGEIDDLESRGAELELLVREAQDELKTVKKAARPSFIRHHASYNSPFLPEGSLALELEDSLRKDVPCPPGYTPSERRRHSARVMQTARVVKRAQQSANHSPGGSTTASVTAGHESCESVIGSSAPSSLYLSEGELSETGYGADVDSVYGSTSALGRPGLPGSNDLETALRRLTLQRTHGSVERDLAHRRHTYRSDGLDTPTSCHTPDSTASRGSLSNLSDFSRISSISSHYRIPGKLQIVKPLEGSFTLHQWKRLATPHLAGVLEHRPGIQNKGDLSTGDAEEEEIYSLSDYEEDDDLSLHLGKCMEQTSGIYTYTTAKILHPSDDFSRLSAPTGPSLFAELQLSSTASYTSLAETSTSYVTSTPRPAVASGQGGYTAQGPGGGYTAHGPGGGYTAHGPVSYSGSHQADSSGANGSNVSYSAHGSGVSYSAHGSGVSYSANGSISSSFTAPVTNVLDRSYSAPNGNIYSNSSSYANMSSGGVSQVTLTSTRPIPAPTANSYARLSDNGTSTFSMSASLARGLSERTIQDGRRYRHIVTETISGATQSQTSLLYSTAQSSMVDTPTGSRVSAATVSEDAYLRLADKVKDIGLNSILNIASRSGLTPVTLDPVDSGFNVIMSIKRSKRELSTAVNRGMAERATGTIKYARHTRRAGKKMAAAALDVAESKPSVVCRSTVPAAPSQKLFSDQDTEEEDEVLKTLLPSIIVAPKKRPDSLSLRVSEVKSTAPLDISDAYLAAMKHPTGSSVDTAVTVSGNTLSSGLLAHLSSVYTRTKDLLGGAADSAPPVSMPHES